jgi:hypothetical protein
MVSIAREGNTTEPQEGSFESFESFAGIAAASTVTLNGSVFSDVSAA